MKSLILAHPGLSVLAALLLGMTLKWVLDLFFLRAHVAQLERDLGERDRELAELKHQHSRVLTELRNRLTELDATQKSKALAEAAGSARERELTDLRLRFAAQENLVAAGRAARDQVDAELQARLADLTRARRLIEQLEGELAEVRAGTDDVRLRLAVAEAEALTHAGAAAELRAALECRQGEAGVAGGRVAELEGRLAATASVAETLEAAVRARDLSVTDLKGMLAEAEVERQSVAKALDAADHQAGAARAEVEQLTRARVTAEAALKRREIELAEWERKAGEFQAAFDDAAQENGKLAADLAKTRAAEAAALAAQAREAEEKTALAAEVGKLRTAGAATERRAGAAELEREALSASLREAEVRAAKASASASASVSAAGAVAAAGDREALARLESERRQAETARAALESELEAVSQSHARLESDLQAARLQLEEWQAQAAAAPPSLPAAAPRPAGGAAETEALMADLEALSRERNELAAELAGLRAAGVGRAAARGPAKPRAVRSRTPAATAPPAGPEPEPKAPEEAPVEIVPSPCPQHLSEVQGIGPGLEQRLYEAGVGSYWDLAQLAPDRLGEILELSEEERDRFDFAATRADAARLAQESGTRGRTWTRELPDDLEPIDGIGPVFEQRLYDAGICTYAALAAATPARLAEICPGTAFKQPDYDGWIAAARARATAGED